MPCASQPAKPDRCRSPPLRQATFIARSEPRSLELRSLQRWRWRWLRRLRPQRHQAATPLVALLMLLLLLLLLVRWRPQVVAQGPSRRRLPK